MRLLPVFALVVACSGPATPPPAVPGPGAERVGGQLLAELLLASHGPLEDAQLTAYVRRVGARVARAVGRRDETWRVELSDDPRPLAHALPGGTLLISRGALAYLSSEAELAAILAHELAHAAQGHTELGKSALPAHATLGAARQSALDADEERQADALAVRYVARAGYDPAAVGRALAALDRAVVLDCRRERERDDCASAHDADDPHPARAARQARVALVAGAGGGEIGRERYLRALDGLPLGGQDAALADRRFRSPGGLSFAVPPGFTPSLSGHVLSATAPGARLTIVRLYGHFFREALLSSVRSGPFSSREVGGHRAFIGALAGDRETLVAVLDAAPFVHVVAVSGTSRAEHLERVLGSVRPTAETEPRLRLRVVTATGRTRFGDLLAQRCPDTDRELAAALNGLGQQDWLPAGHPVKCSAPK